MIGLLLADPRHAVLNLSDVMAKKEVGYRRRMERLCPLRQLPHIAEMQEHVGVSSVGIVRNDSGGLMANGGTPRLLR